MTRSFLKNVGSLRTRLIGIDAALFFTKAHNRREEFATSAWRSMKEIEVN